MAIDTQKSFSGFSTIQGFVSHYGLLSFNCYHELPPHSRIFFLYILSNPGSGKFSISLWIRVVAPQSTTQTVFGTGSSWNTGVLLRVNQMATHIFARAIASNMALHSGRINVYDTLKSWSHIVVAVDWGSMSLTVACKHHYKLNSAVVD